MALNVNNTKGNIVKDPYNSKNNFEKKFEEKLLKFPKGLQPIISEYIENMKQGRNVNGGKGKRGYIHLNTLLSRLIKISQLSEKYKKKLFTELTIEEIHDIFDKMESGKIKKEDGEAYKSTHDYIKVFKAFWNWYIKVNRIKGNTSIVNISQDLSGSVRHKPDFVYFKVESLKLMMDESKLKYKALMYFLFDSGMRVTELMNIQRKDISEAKGDILIVTIRDETSKTFGRTFKLMLCGKLLKEYIKSKDFKPDDFLFDISPSVANKYLRRLSIKLFGKNLKNLKENTKSKKTHITLYDFRHSSCCYWLPRYRSEMSLKYRFGWKSSEMINYYSEFKGMKDTIDEKDLYVDIDKTELERQIDEEKQGRLKLEDEVSEMRKTLRAIKESIARDVS